MMKLLIAGLGMIGLGLGLVVFTHHDPALLFVFGVICSFIAVLHGAMPPATGNAESTDSDTHILLERES